VPGGPARQGGKPGRTCWRQRTRSTKPLVPGPRTTQFRCRGALPRQIRPGPGPVGVGLVPDPPRPNHRAEWGLFRLPDLPLIPMAARLRRPASINPNNVRYFSATPTELPDPWSTASGLITAKSCNVPWGQGGRSTGRRLFEQAPCRGARRKAGPVRAPSQSRQARRLRGTRGGPTVLHEDIGFRTSLGVFFSGRTKQKKNSGPFSRGVCVYCGGDPWVQERPA